MTPNLKYEVKITRIEGNDKKVMFVNNYYENTTIIIEKKTQLGFESDNTEYKHINIININ